MHDPISEHSPRHKKCACCRELVRAKPSAEFVAEAVARARDEQAAHAAQAAASAEALAHTEERLAALWSAKLQQLEV